MKKIILLFVFTVIALISSCKSNNSSNTLKVIKWGPDEVTKIGTVPNKQADGKMGIWIEVSSTEGIGEVQILFAGKSEPTAVQPKLITAGITPDEIAVAGDKKIEIKLVSTGQIVPVGTFKVVP